MDNIEHVTKIFIENLKEIKSQVDESKPQVMPLYDAKKDCQDEFEKLKKQRLVSSSQKYRDYVENHLSKILEVHDKIQDLRKSLLSIRSSLTNKKPEINEIIQIGGGNSERISQKDRD